MARTSTDEAIKQNGHTQSNGNTKPGTQKPLIKSPTLSKRTDYSRWRLLDERGRQTWHYLEDEEDAKDWPQSTADKYFLGLPIVRIMFSLHTHKLIVDRIYPNSQPRKHPSTLLRMVLDSSNIYNYRRGIGHVNMADLCSFFLD